jgi:anti-sigma factor RsiW
MPSLWHLGGHLGSSVSALVDGQLDDETAERAWAHVMHCPPCRRLVEHEGWVKRQLAQIAGAPRPDEPSDQFLGSLLHLDPTAVDASTAWAETDRLEDRSRGRRRAGIALVGAGSVSAAVFGLSTLGATPMGIGGSAGTPASSIGGASTTPTPAFVAPAAAVHGRLRGWTLGSGDSGVAHARSVGDRR